MRRTPVRPFALLPLAVIALFVMAFAAGCGPTYPKCETDSHCAEKGEVCVNGTCQQCRDDSNCGEGQQCAGGRCEAKPECVGNSDCDGNKICRSGKCQLECQAAGDCGTGLKCLNNRCVDELACGMTSDCDPGMVCTNGRCQVAETIGRDMCDYPVVRFDFNRAVLRSEVKTGLQSVVDCLKSKGGTIVIEGHADERGTEEYNLALGDRRARSVASYLERLGVQRSKFRIVSKGELDPVDSSSTESAWAKNRRVEFIER